MKSVLLRVFALILIALVGYGGYRLWDINQNYTQEAAMYNHVQQYRPAAQASLSSTFSTPETAVADTLTSDVVVGNTVPVTINQNILDLQASYPDALGWLTIPNTRIDHPFVQGSDNEHYLHMDLEQNGSGAGTIFIDYRNSKDFSDFNTIFFGHNMRNGSMFGSLRNFNDRRFFESNSTGIIILEDKAYEIEFFAFAVINPDDGVIYNPYIETEAERAEFLDHVISSARYYRDIGTAANDRFVTLSTCNYEFEDARMVLLGRIVS